MPGKTKAAQQKGSAPAKPGLLSAVQDATECFVAVRSAVTRIVTLLGTDSIRDAERKSISKLADELDQFAHNLRDALGAKPRETALGAA